MLLLSYLIHWCSISPITSFSLKITYGWQNFYLAWFCFCCCLFWGRVTWHGPGWASALRASCVRLPSTYMHLPARPGSIVDVFILNFACTRCCYCRKVCMLSLIAPRPVIINGATCLCWCSSQCTQDLPNIFDYLPFLVASWVFYILDSIFRLFVVVVGFCKLLAWYLSQQQAYKWNSLSLSEYIYILLLFVYYSLVHSRILGFPIANFSIPGMLCWESSGVECVCYSYFWICIWVLDFGVLLFHHDTSRCLFLRVGMHCIM